MSRLRTSSTLHQASALALTALLAAGCGTDEASPGTGSGTGPEPSPGTPGVSGQAGEETDDSTPILHSAPGETATGGVQAAIERLDPAAAGWRSEVLHELAKAKLSLFVAELVGGAGAAALARHVTPEFGTSPLRPEGLETVLEDAGLHIRRGSRFSDARLPSSGLARLATAWLEPFEPGVSAEHPLHVKTKIFTTELDPKGDDTFSTRALVRLDGPARGGGLVQSNAEWTLSWSVEPALTGDESQEAVRIRSISVDTYEEAHARAPLFAGRRYVATREHRALRYPDLSPVVPNVRSGSYLALYWIEAGHHDEAEGWAVERVNELNVGDRMHPREQAHAGFYEREWSWRRDPDGVPVELALDHPYRGLLFLCIDRAANVSSSVLGDWYRDEFLPSLGEESRVASCLASRPLPLPADTPSYVRRLPGLDRRTLLLLFCEADPSEIWNTEFAHHARTLDESKLGAISFASPFVPTIPGTDAYCDEV